MFKSIISAREVGYLFLVVFLTGLFGWTIFSFTDETNSSPPLFMDPESLSFGEVWEDSNFKWKALIQNRGQKEIDLVGFSTTCSCLSIEPKAMVLGPGETAPVLLTLDLTHRSADETQQKNPFSVTLYPQVKGVADPIEGFTINGIVRRWLWISAQTLDFGEKPMISGLTPAPKPIFVASCVPLDRLTASWEKSRMDIEIEPIVNSNSKFIVRVKPHGDIPPGIYRDDVELIPNLAAKRNLPSVRLTVFNTVLSDIVVSPPNLIFTRLDSDAGNEAIVNVCARSGKAVTRAIAIEEPREGNAEVISISSAKRLDESTFTFRLSVKKNRNELSSSRVKFRVFFSGTDAPAEQRIEVLFGAL